LGVANVPAIFTLNPNNDNSTGPGASDNNILVPLKRFDFQDYIDIEFSVLASAGVSEYVVTEFVDNNTGNIWAGYKMYLGTGTGANFTQLGLPAGLDFDTGPPGGNDLPPASAAFTTVSRPNDITLEFSGGSQGPGAQLYTFRIDVPDMNELPELVGTFTLRQVPVPEPATLALASLAMTAFAALRRRTKTVCRSKLQPY
jgi:hypothetical protein